MQLSSLPFLIVIIFGFLLFLTQRLYRLGRLKTAQRNWIGVLLGILLCWGGISGCLSSSGVYVAQAFLDLAPGYWLPYVPVVIAMTLVMTVRPLRQGLRILVDDTPVHWLIGIHQLRILALGSIIKASNGLFPQKFAWYVGIPDLMFGITAMLVSLLLLRRGRFSDWFLIPWHLLGAMVIVIPATGLMHVYMQEPLFSELLAFPMALAPTLVVPTFVMLNLLVVWRLAEHKLNRSSDIEPRSE